MISPVATHEYQDPAFWVNVGIAVGTIAAAVVAAVLGVSASRAQARRDERAKEADRRQITAVLGRREDRQPGETWGWVEIVNASANLITDLEVRLVFLDYEWVWDPRLGDPPRFLPPGHVWRGEGSFHPVRDEGADTSVSTDPPMRYVGWYLRWRDTFRNVVTRDSSSGDPMAYRSSD
jgi:hypothetical protein